VTVNIPHEYLEQLYDLKQDGKLTGLSYVEVLNALEIKLDCERINSTIRRYCGEIKNKSKRLAKSNAFLFTRRKLPGCLRQRMS
jgi:hypothetical protein